MVALVLVLLLAWPVGLMLWANGRLDRVEALSDAPSTTGTTYLLAGSDARGEIVDDATEGSRTDTVMLLHAPPSGPAALISLPRDTYVQIPEYGANKLNAAYAFGGPALLVGTVEQLTGLTVDHYVEIGLDGVAGVVDAVGGVELCLDYDVDDWRSKLQWEAGCRVADGPTALAFSRMRYADPEGDIGRTQRQQQVIQAVASSVADPSLAVKPGEQVSLIRAGTDALAVSEGTSVLDLGRLALAFRAATGPDGVRGTPPIASADYRPGGVGSTVLLDEELTPTFWADLRDGNLEPGSTVGGLPD
jgi:LCP family protein required for cell wall assembly